MVRHSTFRPSREHRRAGHVGRVRERLAAAIVQAFADQQVQVRCTGADLHPAQGHWRTDPKVDVMRWHGSLEILRHGNWQRAIIESWDKMSNCIKGFTVWQDGGSFELASVEPDCSPSERYVYENKS